MPKGKHAPSLYEVMGRGRVQEPDTRTPAEIARDRARELDIGASLWGAKPDPHRRSEPTATTPKPQSSETPKSGLELIDGRVVASLTHRLAAVLLFGIMALVFIGGYVGYQAGKAAGITQGKSDLQAATDKELETARNTAPTKEDIFAGTGGQSPLLRSNAAESRGESSTSADPTEWITGYTYVCIQDFRASEKEALRSAQEFLKDRGIETEVIEREKGDFRFSLYSKRGFNTKDPIQQQRLKDFWGQIREIGKEFRKAGGKHNLEGYLAELKP